MSRPAVRGVLAAVVLVGVAASGAIPVGGCAPAAQDRDPHAARRLQMVADQIAARGVTDERVLAAMRDVPRHLFVPLAMRSQAYEDHPLPIGHGQTISQPYIVAYMTEVLRLKPTSRVLEVGTGSGYQAAVLGKVAGQVYTVEILAPLAESAKKTLASLGFTNVHVKVGDGFAGWPEHAPFDAVIVTAAPEEVPPPLIEQLAVGGRLVVPVGRVVQQLTLIEKTPKGLVTERKMPVRFVPLVRQ
jgi:protein-L-isoaspartate(D-aspartate) O-methyltransferase